jgi:hypothetical protein
MTQCKPYMNNHYAALIPGQSPSGQLVLNDLVNQQGMPWWKKAEEMNGYGCAAKQPKPQKQEKEMNKEEQKQYNVALTYHYLKEQDSADEVAMEMDKWLENAIEKDDVAKYSVVSDGNSYSATSGKRASAPTLSRKYVGCTWKQRAVIIFIFLHPEIGRRSHEITCLLTGVKEQTLSGWLTQKRMVQMWVDVVEDMKAEIAIRSLPAETQDSFVNVDP